ncbi:MAG: hypothetical protein HY314_08560 [Acidobacteria bacterium]|nr:hypothetical protein [Acidobacteriota bacterium]
MRNAWDTQHSLEDTTPSDPLKCVWMLAGVVDYKLCDREYDCERCPFDTALRESTSSQIPRAKAAIEVSLLGRQPTITVKDQAMSLVRRQRYGLAESFFYHPSHIWARVEDGGRVRIGLDDFGQKLVGRIYAISLPEPGTRVTRGSACWSIVHQAGEATLAAPVTGVVQQLNEKLALNPSLINHDPYNQGWAMMIQPEQLVENLEHLYYGQQAEHWYDQEIEKLYQELRILMEDARPDVGVTLQDGGLQVADLPRVITASQFRQIIDTFLSATTGHEPGSIEDQLTTDGSAGR